MANGKNILFTVISLVMAAGLWTVMFCPATARYVNFWGMMCISAVFLVTLPFFARARWWEDVSFGKGNIIAGIAIAACLWGIFWIGDKAASVLFDFAGEQVESIYDIRSGVSPWLLSCLLLFLIGPAEEIFWRGYIQKTLSGIAGRNAGFLLSTLIYAGVHVPSGNFMLVMAALVAGTVWGLVYRLRPDRLGALLVSHALWDAAVFVWFPI